MSIRIIAGMAGLALFLVVLIYFYNRLVRMRYSVRNSWSDIDVHLKKRYELLPNLVEAVRGYAAHERGTFLEVVQQRSTAMRAQTPGQKARADNMLTGTMKSLFAVAEAYPELMADEHFMEIMEEMKEIEDNIEHARRFYNMSVRDYNVATGVFPTNVVAAAFSFRPEEFFSLDDPALERKPFKASFSGI